jgi:hypothetical protein
VRDDGSAFFRVPARTPVYFQLLDSNNRMVASMRSWVTLQPGENAACVGCHETKNSTPVAAAANAGVPEMLRPFYGVPRGFSFPREIQPILNRHCVACHDNKHKVPLTSDEILDAQAKRRWSRAYLTLTHAGDANHPVVNWISAQSAPPMLPPYSAGSAKSKLISQLESGHNRVKLLREEMDKLAAWIDLGVPYCADYRESNAWTDAERAKYDRYQAKRERLATEERAAIAELAGNP